MKNLLDLFPIVDAKIQAPVAIALGPIWPVTQLVQALGDRETVCFQMDAYQAERLREKLDQEQLQAEVVIHPDLWDLPARFQTVIFPSGAQADRELKLDIVEQAYHILLPGGLFMTLSEYERDSLFARFHKKVFGKCSEAPRNKSGSVFWSVRPEETTKRRRHETRFHARIGERPSLQFQSWPGTFSYGEMDSGSRAMLEVAELRNSDHILDLGCGNGAVGCLAAQMAGSSAKVTFIDSHARAVKLAELNAEQNAIKNTRFFRSANLTELRDAEFDVVLANPPYYNKSEVARLFIDTARRVLRPGGRFYFVTKMPVQTIPEIVDTFGNVESIENRNYTVVMATA